MTTVPITRVVLSSRMVEKINEIITTFDATASGFETRYSSEMPLENYKLEELSKIRYAIIGEDDDGLDIIDETKITEIPAIDVCRDGDKYLVINGRHRMVDSILKCRRSIKVNIH